MSSSAETGTVSTEGGEELEQAQQKLQQTIASAAAAARSLEREKNQQEAAIGELRATLEARQHAAATSLATAAKLISALDTPNVLWSEVVRDIAQLGDGREQDELVSALQESSAICETFIARGGDKELVKRIDEVIEMLGGD